MTVNEYNYAQLRQTARNLAETIRHNRISEGIEQGKLAETQRHQMASELIDRGRLDESIRHDSAVESIQSQSNAITDWYNRNRSQQEDAKIAQSGLSTAANVAKTNKETSLLERSTEADIYSKYRQADARTTSAQASANEARIHEYNAKVNTVLNTGNWVTNTLTNLFKLGKK